MLRFDKATYLSPLFKFTQSERLDNNIYRSEALLFLSLKLLYPLCVICVLNSL